MNLTPEQREVGRDNYYDVVSDYDRMTRRGFLQNVVAFGGVGAAGVGAYYFGYHKPNNPVRIGFIGTGDEGNVLIGALNPDYVQVKAIADIRPSSVHRAFHGDWATGNTIKVRPGLMDVYGYKSHQQATQNIAVYQDYKEILNDPDIEGVVIALPLHLHAPVAIEAMKAGKHVLTEKLMAHNVAQCKLMGRVSEETQKYCATGHQRHYSILYDNAVNLIRWGVLGEIHHVRAQWHRGNLPGNDSWAMPIPGGEFVKGSTERVDQISDQIASMQKSIRGNLSAKEKSILGKKIDQWIAWDQDKSIDAKKFGYMDTEFGGRNRSALEELVRWRVWDRTGGGLMAELGSHQLDAASIIISALRKDKVHPLTVHAIGGRHIFPENRDADDHVYCSFEFPGPGYDLSENFNVGYNDKVEQVPGERIPSYDEDGNKKIVVTYSSINGNGFGGYGEVVMGTKGTLVLDKEKEVMLYKNSSTTARVGAKKDKAGAATLDTTASGDGAVAKAAEQTGPVSRGYAEEIEHWAWCIRTKDWDNQPRCKPDIAVADAVIALTAKQAMKNGQDGKATGGFIQFKEEWFDINKDDVPEVDAGGREDLSIKSVKKSVGLT